MHLSVKIVLMAGVCAVFAGPVAALAAESQPAASGGVQDIVVTA